MADDTATPAVQIVAAATLRPADLVALFNAGFSDYLVPMRLDVATFGDHVEGNDIDLRDSRVVLAGRPAAFALLARRGADAWIGGMATSPAHRRCGHGERALIAALDAARDHGCRTAWLEVVHENGAAIALYAKLGFEVVRDLVVWSLAATGRRATGGRAADESSAHAWIGANRRDREPWQRADGSLRWMRGRRPPPRAAVLERGGEVAAAVVYREHAGTVTTVQAAAVDEAAAADVLLTATRGEAELRFANVPSGDPFSRALGALGARALARQHEMCLRLSP